MIRSKYLEKVNLNFGTDSDGVTFHHLDLMVEMGYTTLSKGLNNWIIELVKSADKFFNPDSIIHVHATDIGAFSTLSSKKVWHITHETAINLTVNELSHFRKCLFLYDFMFYSNLANFPKKDVKKVFDIFRDFDNGIICCNSEFFKGEINIREILLDMNIFINGIFCFDNTNNYSDLTNKTDSATPLGLSLDGDNLYLIYFSKKFVNKEFVCHFEKFNNTFIKRIFNSYTLFVESDSISTGVLFNANEYMGLQNYKTKASFMEIEKALDLYNLLPIKDLVVESGIKLVEINNLNQSEFQHKLLVSTKEGHDKKLKIGNQFTIYPLGQIPNYLLSKSNQFYLIEFNEAKMHIGYLGYFLKSSIGKNYINGISELNFENINEVKFPTPNIETQLNIFKTLSLLDESKEKIKSLSIDFINCLSSKDENLNSITKLHNLLEIFSNLTDYEKIKKLISYGESKTLEFKQTLNLCLSKKTKEQYIQDAWVKTIAAFLNSDGGILLIGVADGGEIPGCDDEISLFYKSTDKFLLHFKNVIKNRIGEQFYPYINSAMVNCEGKLILKIECERAKKEVYVDSKDFYVRTNPATDKLEGPKVIEYIKNHFNFNF